MELLIRFGVAVIVLMCAMGAIGVIGCGIALAFGIKASFDRFDATSPQIGLAMKANDVMKNRLEEYEKHE